MSKKIEKTGASGNIQYSETLHGMDALSKDARAKQVDDFYQQKTSTPPPPRYNVTVKDSNATISIEPNPENMISLMDACGTTDYLFAQNLVSDIATATCYNARECEEHTLNAGLAALAGINPTDEMEAMLAAQMVATHKAAMKMIGKTMNADRLDVAQWQSGFAVKLLRTYTMQMEAMKRYRGKGEQKVTVEHVHVHAGGQAIVGNVNPTGGGGVAKQMEEQPHAKQIENRPAVYAPISTMPCADKEKYPVPVTGNAKR